MLWEGYKESLWKCYVWEAYGKILHETITVGCCENTFVCIVIYYYGMKDLQSAIRQGFIISRYCFVHKNPAITLVKSFTITDASNSTALTRKAKIKNQKKTR